MQTLKLTKKYEKYPEYKDSGVEWLGMIPKGWDIVSSRQLFTTTKERVGSNFADHKILSLTLHGVVPKNLDGSGKNPAEYDTYQEFKKDDLVFCLFDYDVTPRTIGYVEEDGMMTGAYTRLIPQNGVHSKYFYYYFLVLDHRKELLHLCTGLRNSLSKPVFWSMKSSLPHFTEQQRITKYLDEKIALIDQIIEKKEKQIELLKEKKVSFINDLVNNTKGFEEKLKYIAPEKNIKVESLPPETIYIGMENIESGTGRYTPSIENLSPESVANIFSGGDVLFGKLRPYLAKVYSPDFNGVCSGEFLVLKPRKNKVSSKFLFYKLISKDFIKKVDDSTYGTKMPRANWQFIGNQFITYPDILKQNEIVEELDNKTKLYEEVINDVAKSIEVLKEFKTSLISNVVTGKIKV